MRAPGVSVVVPTFNRWPLLSRALASVLAQRDVDLEVLVVDDCSFDDTPEQLAAIGDPRLRILRQETNMGVARARNRGIEEARAAWVAFLDDDDFWAPTKLAEHLRCIEAAGASWGYGASIAFSEGTGNARHLMVPASPRELRTGLLEANVAGAPSSATVRQDVLRAVGGFDDNLSVLADWDLWIRLDRCGHAAFCPLPLVAYCHHTSNMQSMRRAAITGELEYMARKYEHLMPDDRSFGTRTVQRFRAEQDRLDGHRFRAAVRYGRIGVRERSGGDLMRGLGSLVGERIVGSLRASSRSEPTTPDWLLAAARATTADPQVPADTAVAHSLPTQRR